MTEETIRFLLEQKIQFINMAANVCMLWWVSGTVLCASALAAVWIYRDSIRTPNLIRFLGFILFFFFTTVVIFGLLVIIYLATLQKEISDLAAQLPGSPEFFVTEVKVFQFGMIVGTSSFVLIWFSWLLMWYRLWMYRIDQGIIPRSKPKK